MKLNTKACHESFLLYTALALLGDLSSKYQIDRFMNFIHGGYLATKEPLIEIALCIMNLMVA